MSLKTFHIFFIMVAALFCLSMSLWAFFGSSSDVLGDVSRPFGAVAAISGAALFGYGLWFAIRKSKALPA